MLAGFDDKWEGQGPIAPIGGKRPPKEDWMNKTLAIVLVLIGLMLAGCGDEAMDALAAEVAALSADVQAKADQEDLDAIEVRLATLEAAAGIDPNWDDTIDDRLTALEGAGFMLQATFDETAAAELTDQDLDDLAEAYDWGDHSVEGYLTGETDPVASSAGYLTVESDPVASAAGYLTVETDPVAMAEIPDLEGSIVDLEAGKVGRISYSATPLALVVSTAPAADEFASIGEALAWLDGYSIDSDATVQIQVQAGTYTHSTVYLRHPDGDRIQIIGAGPGLVTLQCAGSGFRVWDGHSLGLLDGMTIEGPGTSGSDYGVDVRRNSYAWLGSELLIRDFYGAVLSYRGGVVFAGGVTAENVVTGFAASGMSFLFARSATVNGATNDGFQSVSNSFVDVRNTILTGIDYDGYDAWFGGVLDWNGGNGVPDPTVSGTDPAFISP